MSHLKVLTDRGEDQPVGPDTPALSRESDVQQQLSGQQTRQPLSQVVSVTLPLDLHCVPSLSALTVSWELPGIR